MSGPDPISDGELLSALLDGELDPAQQAALEARLAADPALAAELDALARVRAALRGLPAVEPPAGFYEGLLDRGGPAAVGSPVEAAAPSAQVTSLGDHRRRRRGLLVGLAGAAAAAVVVVVLAVGSGGGGDDGMVPPVADFAARHDAMATTATAVGARDGFEPMSSDELDAMEGPMAAPSEAGTFERLAGYHDAGGTMHLVYGADGMVVSVYAQPGQVDFGALPGEGERMEVPGGEAWMDAAMPVDGSSVEVLVVQRGDTAYTFVADAPHDDVMQVVDGLGAATGA